MPKVQIPKKSISIDMTPMVDMAFLLVTFFMLTTQFRPDEPVKVNNPKSVSQIPVPEKNKTTIEVSDDGRVFFDFNGKFYRQNLIAQIGRRYNINFTQDEINTFAVQATMGIPIGQLKQYLDTEVEARKKIRQEGIPIQDSTNNELRSWLLYSRAANPSSIIIIKADNMAQYGVVKKVIKTLQDQDINRFSLITDAKDVPIAQTPNTGTK